MKKNRCTYTNDITKEPAALSAEQLDRTRTTKVRSLLVLAMRYARQFRMQAANYYKSCQYASAVAFLTMAKKLDQIQADARTLMSTPKYQEVMTGLIKVIEPMIPSNASEFNTLHEKVQEVFGSETYEYDDYCERPVSEAEMRELQHNFDTSMDPGEIDAFRRMEAALNE